MFVVTDANAFLAAPVYAQTYPSRPVRMVVPYAPGGATDIIARIVAQKLADRLGQSVVVENKPGAGTTDGNAEVAKARPDGYTFLFAPTPFVISQVVYPTLPYDPQKDFAPVSLLATSPFILVVNAAFPAKSTAELVALAKAKPGTIAFASAGNGTTRRRLPESPGPASVNSTATAAGFAGAGDGRGGQSARQPWPGS